MGEISQGNFYLNRVTGIVFPIAQSSQTHNTIGRIIDSNILSLHPFEKLCSFAFASINYIALVACFGSGFKTVFYILTDLHVYYLIFILIIVFSVNVY